MIAAHEQARPVLLMNGDHADTEREMFVVMYRNEDGNWYLESGRLIDGVSFWTMDRSEAMHFYTQPYAELVARTFEQKVSREQIRGPVKIKEIKKK